MRPERSYRTQFFEPGSFDQATGEAYSLLPFNFTQLSDGRRLLTNDLGKFTALGREAFEAFVTKTLPVRSEEYIDLKALNFLADAGSSVHSRLLASQLRTRKSFLDGFTKLHILVASLRCDHSCPYCQVSRQSEDRFRYDMTPEMAERSIDLVMRAPAHAVTIEFQGGEPLLNFDLVRHAILYAEQKNEFYNKAINFVICTNLSTITDDHLAFCKDHGIKISSSLDGPEYLHDKNRPFGRKSSYATVVKNLERVREALGKENLSCLMTTTRESLKYPHEIVDEYLKLDLGSIFVRPLSPYGFAVKTWKAIGYEMEEFIEFYKTVLSYVIEINRSGRTFPEAYASMLLQKILTPFPLGYVDLQSPAGAGFGVAVYNYDGDVYASDESRMLAEMQDPTFRLGNVLENSYEEIFFGERMQLMATASCNEALAGCSECAFQPYCGADPVYHYATQRDIYGNRAASGFCKKHTATFRHLFDLVLNGDTEMQSIFWSWITDRSVDEVKLVSGQ